MKEYSYNVGDYVICQEDKDSIQSKERDFLSTNIGRIFSQSIGYDYIIHYNNIPDNLHSSFFYEGEIGHRPMDEQEIIYCSDTIEKLEVILNMDKYNL